MRPRTSPDRIATVQRLLRGGMSQREVAKRTGVSRPIVIEIDNGNRSVQFSEDGPTEFQKVNAYICPGCHCKVETAPCVACSSKRRA